MWLMFFLQFGVPSYIVSLRHECVHGILSSLESLKCATDFGLQCNCCEPQRWLNQQMRERAVIYSSPRIPSLWISFYGTSPATHSG
ncbi:hypothetical protein GBAR_LOCUS12994 [Geodia barretti]|uniref:Secreted protein n=1 Tax=Geodia barretti TaxID=519541 RepID=A0AA35S2J2_GEOBA|nr:hypothetical protein GBAR_LOCUS12994 [Geodia barretti]